ncbi:MAG: glycosyltransferase family 2 protein, partial [Cyanobacteria bacterium J06628_3]
ISKKLGFGNRFLSKVVGKLVGKADKLLNHYITSSYARKHLQNNSNQNPPTQPPSAVTASSQG